MSALELLKEFWKPLAGVLLAIALYFAWNAYIGSVEKRGYDKGHAVGLLAGYDKGYPDGHKRAIKDRQAADDEKLAEATTLARAAEIKLAAELNDQAVKRQLERGIYEKTIDDLRAAARSGNSGMRLPAGTCPDRGAGLPADAAPESASTAGGPVDPEAGVHLLPSTAESVLDAGGHLRQAMRDRNTLIGLYEQCRAMANAP